MLERTPDPEHDGARATRQPRNVAAVIAPAERATLAPTPKTGNGVPASDRAVRWIITRLGSDTRAGVALMMSMVAALLLGLVAGGELTTRAALLLFAIAAGVAALVTVERRQSTTAGDPAPLDGPGHCELPADGRTGLVPGPTAGAETGLVARLEAIEVQHAAVDLGHAILAAIPDAALIVDRSGLIVETNPLVSQMFPRGRPGLLVNQMCRSPEVVDAVERALVSGRVVVEIEEWVPVRRKLMMTVAALGGVAVLPPAPNAALLIVFRDVSEQEKLAQMRADFIANASHELRTPLASLRGFVETLQGPARDDAVARDRFLAIMATQANRMTRLIDDLLSLSRVEMRVHVPPTGTVDLVDVAQFVIQTIEPLAAGYQAQVTLIAPDTPTRVRGERDELVQVVQNLIHNALKYGQPTGGTIAVRIVREARGRAERHRVTLEIEDNGLGIAAAHLPRLTERFYRVSPTISRDRGGTGLGLAIVKNIVTRHRGELGIRSEPGKGSVFSVTLDELEAPAKP